MSRDKSSKHLGCLIPLLIILLLIGGGIGLFGGGSSGLEGDSSSVQKKATAEPTATVSDESTEKVDFKETIFSIAEHLISASTTEAPTATPVVVNIVDVWIDAIGVRYEEAHLSVDELIEKFVVRTDNYEVKIHDEGASKRDADALEEALEGHSITYSYFE